MENKTGDWGQNWQNWQTKPCQTFQLDCIWRIHSFVHLQYTRMQNGRTTHKWNSCSYNSIQYMYHCVIYIVKPISVLFKEPLITSFTSLIIRQINTDGCNFFPCLFLGFEIFGRLINQPKSYESEIELCFLLINVLLASNKFFLQNCLWTLNSPSPHLLPPLLLNSQPCPLRSLPSYQNDKYWMGNNYLTCVLLTSSVLFYWYVTLTIFQAF